MPNYNYPGPYYGVQQTSGMNSYGYANPSYGFQSFPQQSYGMEPNQQTNSVVWVQGEAGANAYPVAKGQTVMLMDANPNSNMFYLKSADPYSGRPLPLEKYHYQRVYENSQNEQNSSHGVEAQSTSSTFVPREEFDMLKEKIDKLQKSIDNLVE